MIECDIIYKVIIIKNTYDNNFIFIMIFIALRHFIIPIIRFTYSICIIYHILYLILLLINFYYYNIFIIFHHLFRLKHS